MAKTVFQKTRVLTDKPFHYCPGCTHGIANRIISESIEELGLEEKAVGVAPVGCGVFIYNYIDCDMYVASHGRAPAVATGAKRVCPDNLVFAYQGDGDLAAIGTSEIVHAAARGENITAIFINNAIYGMTGGQMAPTTLPRQKSTTTPDGRDAAHNGMPLRMAEMLATLDGAAYIERVSLHDVKHIVRAKKAVKKAFEKQMKKNGFTMVEMLSACPSNWGLTPIEALKWIENNMIPYYSLGIKKEV